MAPTNGFREILPAEEACITLVNEGGNALFGIRTAGKHRLHLTEIGYRFLLAFAHAGSTPHHSAMNNAYTCATRCMLAISTHSSSA